MDRDNFQLAIETAQMRKPFKPYRVRFVSGRHIDVDHPETLVFRRGVGAHIGPDGRPTLFDHETVSEIIGEADRQSA